MATIPQAADETLWSRFASIGNVAPLFRMLWSTSPFLFLGTILVRMGRAVLPMALLWIPKKIVDGVIAVTHQHGNLSHVWHLLALELVLALVLDMLTQANTVLDSLLGERFTTDVAIKLIDHVTQLDLTTFEDPVFYDKLERVRGQATGRMVLLTSVMNAGQEAITLFTLFAGLILFSPWLVVLLSVSMVPAFIGEARFSKLSYSAFYKRTPQRRELEYLRLLGSWFDSAKEVRIFGLSPYLSSKYRDLSEEIYSENSKLAITRALGGWGLGMLAILGYYSGYVVVLRAALVAAISIGTFTFMTGSLVRSRMSIERAFTYLNGVTEQAVLLNDLFEIFELRPTITSPPNALPVPHICRDGIEFRNVSFRYPSTDIDVLRNVNLRIRPSEKLALIGENGAGKSTIVKLLTRLYEPASGEILLDGINIRNYDLLEFRARISVIFQDFMRYDLPVRENIGFGALSALMDDTRLMAASRKAGAHVLVNSFPNGYDQVLGRRFNNGIDLSGGEWQKIALARAFTNNAQLLILDEPTASLDAQAEDDFFRRLRGQSVGPMVVLISHKLSTVRTADHIVVLDSGEIVEEGTHDELVKLNGRYTRLFNLQAAGFLGVNDDMSSDRPEEIFAD